jgi:phosphohistidine phosphatase SixA
MWMVAPLPSKKVSAQLDPRAQATGEALAEALTDGAAAAIVGPSYSGKTQAAMAALRVLDPSGASTAHTSAAILNTNAPVAQADRSATWSSYSQLLERFGETAPRFVVIDEAGSTAAPVQPVDLYQAKARALLSKWRDAGTTFVVIGHQLNDRLESWASWLGDGRFAVVDAPTGVVRPARAKLEPQDRPANPVAEKNERGAQGRERMHRPLGNAFFARFDDDR